LLYLGSLLIAVAPVLADTAHAALGQSTGQEPGQRLWVFGTLTGALAVHAVAMMPAALDRPDPGHVLYNGIGVFLLTMLTPWSTSTRAIRAGDRAVSRRWLYQAAFFLIFPILSIAVGRGDMLSGLKYLATLRAAQWSEQNPGNVLARGVERTLGEAEWNRLHRNLLGFRQRSLENLFPGLSGYGKICDPWGEPEIFSILGRHDALQADYYYGFTDEPPVREVRRKLEDVRSCTYVILPAEALMGMPRELPLDMDYYSQLLMFPVWGPPMIPAKAPQREFYQYVQASFVPLRQVTPGMYLCRKKQPETPSP
jgi:hypothetical protein